MWVRRCIGASLIGLLGAACSSGSPTPTVTMSAPDHASYPMPMVVERLRKECPTSAGRVTLDLVIDEHVRRTFKCATVRGPVGQIETLLVRAVARHRHAAQRADRILSFEHALGLPLEERRSDLVWLLGTRSSDFSCDRASDVTFRRDEIIQARSVGENAMHWLKVEAAFIAGACPDRLEELYQTVIKAGQPDAVATVRSELSTIRLG